MEDLIRYIIRVSEMEACSDNENFETYGSGNYDDTYEIGTEDGEILFARELVKKFNLK